MKGFFNGKILHAQNLAVIRYIAVNILKNFQTLKKMNLARPP
jgi:hypothetical protein